MAKKVGTIFGEAFFEASERAMFLRDAPVKQCSHDAQELLATLKAKALALDDLHDRV